MQEFKNYHPITNFIFFISVIGFSMFILEPVCLGISLASGILYSGVLGGAKKLKVSMIYMMPMIILTMLLNPLFNHQGDTILGYFPWGNPFTKESVLYGICAGAMLAGVTCWFSCLNEIMTSDKLMYLFGRIMPSLSLIFSMTLRFVPHFFSHLKEVKAIQKTMGKDISSGNFLNRIKNGLKILSVMITWALENSIETADSMKARGYGLKGRTAFSNFKFHKQDLKILILLLIFDTYILCGKFIGELYFECFPEIIIADFSIFKISIYIVHSMLYLMPVIIECWEGYRWKLLKSKI